MMALRLCLAALVLLLARPADAAEIALLSSNAIREAYEELVPQFEKMSGHHVTAIWAGAADLKRRIEGGAAADAVITPAADIDALIAGGKLLPGSRSDIAKSPIGVAVRAGLPKPDISSGEKVKAALLAAHAIVVSGGPSGLHLLELFEKQGLLGVLRPKLKQLASGQSVGEALAQGQGDIGFTQASEFLTVKGIVYAGLLPPEMQQVTVFSAGITKNARQAEAAKALVRFLTGPQAAAVLRKTGLEPGG